MSKPNFSKVEKSLEEGMIRMKAEHLLNEADAIKGGSEKIPSIPSKDICTTVLLNLEKDLKKIRKEDESLYKTFYKFDLKKLIDNPSELTPQDWKTVKEIKERVEHYKKELAEKLPHESDQELIDHERTSHLNKRLNVSNKKWIPLDRIPN